MEHFAIASLVVNAILIGLAIAAYAEWKRDTANRLTVMAEALRLKQEFQESVKQVAEIHNATAVSVNALQDRMQALELGLSAVTQRTHR